MRFRRKQTALWTALALLSVTGLAACGGGGTTVAGGGSGGTGVVAIGSMTKGSVKTNNVNFVASSTAKIRQEDNGVIVEVQANPANEDRLLRNGMTVKVKGRINDNPATAEVEGEFDKIKPEPEARGRMERKNTGTNGIDDFFVNGRHVFTDDNTAFEDRSVSGTFTVIAFDNLSNTQNVEVHGGLDDAGNIRATRVERRNDNPNDDIKGTVSALVPGTSFTLTYGAASFTVTYPGATVTPAGASVVNGSFVEVYGTFTPGTPPTFTATRVHIEDLEDVEFEPAEGQEQRVEGYVSGYSNDLHNFLVGNTPVDASSAAFTGGSALDLANGVKVEAEGHHSAGKLIASKIEFKRSRIVLEGLPSGRTATQVTVAGEVAAITSITDDRYSGTGRMRVRGYEDKSGAIVAERLEDAGGGGGRDVIQARVTATNGSSSLTLLGTTYTAAAGAVYQDVNNNVITASAFFAAVVPKSATSPGTLVKIKFNPGTTSYEEAELEN
ncbi:MAG TPA: DUF5666 domain-containing protein [Candidatus Deferrimicrobiaceae bacterium]